MKKETKKYLINSQNDCLNLRVSGNFTKPTINNKMKKMLSILIFTISFANLFGQSTEPTTKANEKSFPTNINERNFKKLKKFNGQIVAFDGTIEQIENSRNDTPFYKLKIGENDYLWTVLMFKNEKNTIGDKIRVVGYLRPSDPNETEKKYLEGKYMVLSFGLVDLKSSNFLFISGAEIQKQEWINGKIPSSK
ncbi:MAG: hypothetical protein WDA08_08510 [Weeksellaceae bacterium]